MDELDKLKVAIRRLLNRVNRVTCNHRHGQPVREQDLTDLSNYQITFEHILENSEALSPQWISVEDRLPEESQTVLAIFDHGDKKEIALATLDRWWKVNSITHWMPLPQPPREG